MQCPSGTGEGVVATPILVAEVVVVEVAVAVVAVGVAVDTPPTHTYTSACRPAQSPPTAGFHA